MRIDGDVVVVVGMEVLGTAGYRIRCAQISGAVHYYTVDIVAVAVFVAAADVAEDNSMMVGGCSSTA